MRRFPMIEEGASGEMRVAAGPSLWRGIAAGGTDEGALVLESKERVLVHDSVVRPSTLPGWVSVFLLVFRNALCATRAESPAASTPQSTYPTRSKSPCTSRSSGSTRKGSFSLVAVLGVLGQ